MDDWRKWKHTWTDTASLIRRATCATIGYCICEQINWNYSYCTCAVCEYESAWRMNLKRARIALNRAQLISRTRHKQHSHCIFPYVARVYDVECKAEEDLSNTNSRSFGKRLLSTIAHIHQRAKRDFLRAHTYISNALRLLLDCKESLWELLIRARRVRFIDQSKWAMSRCLRVHLADNLYNLHELIVLRLR